MVEGKCVSKLYMQLCNHGVMNEIYHLVQLVKNQNR